MQRTHTRAALAALFVACGLGLSACNGNSAEGGPGNAANGTPASAGGNGKSYKLAATVPTFNHPFFVSMKRGLEDEAQKAGSEISVNDGKNDAQAQISQMETFAVQQVDGIILCPTETDSLPPGVQHANQKNIPVITVNRRVSAGDVVTYVGADDVEGGRLQGRAVIDALPKGGKILLLQGVIGSSPQRDREAGLLEVLKGRPEYEIVSRAPYDFDRTKGVSVMETALNQFPKGAIDCVVAQSDDGALAAADVAGQRGRTELKIIGFNGESAAFDAITAGKIYATVLQDAETQGREAVKATLAHLNGEQVKKEIITPLYLIKKDNIGEHKPAWQSN
ncbi:MAG: sugar ABC transporter substrate-binding protein [Armatimonadota bacterium]